MSTKRFKKNRKLTSVSRNATSNGVTDAVNRSKIAINKSQFFIHGELRGTQQ